jgi:hypothetical protein
MKENLLDYLKRTYQENDLFELSDINIKGSSEAAIKEDLLRLTKTKQIKRLGYGVYYLPSSYPNTQPSAIHAIEIRYLQKGNEIFGFYTGPQFLSTILHAPLDNQNPLEIMSNKITSGKKSVFQFSHRLILRKPYFTIDRTNVSYNSFLSYISMAPFAEIQRNYSILATYIRNNHLSANDVIRSASFLPSKTASKLLSSDLYRCLWKH